MLGTGARYAEYGITGGFFLLTSVLVLGLYFPTPLLHGAEGLGSLSTEIINKIPESAKSAIQSLLVALGLLSVFIVGLMLEIVGSILMAREAHVFRQHLLANEWIAKFIQTELPDYEADYVLFLEMTDPQIQKEEALKRREEVRKAGFKPWKMYPAQFRLIAETFRKMRSVQQRFRRLEFNLMAKVLTSGAKTEILADQISIVRMSRGIATTLYAASTALSVGNTALAIRFIDQMKLEDRIPSVALATALTAVIFVVFVALVIMVASLLFACSAAITRGAYSRFSYILFSLVYAGWKSRPSSQPVTESRN